MDNVTIKEGVILGNNVIKEDDVYIDYGCIIRDNVHIKKGSFIGARSILGEYLMDFYKDKTNKYHPLLIGENAIIRSENVIYGGNTIGDNFQTGHKVTIRESNIIVSNVRLGTLADIQHRCSIGSYVSIHSGVFIGEETIIKDYAWIFPHAVLTNDPTPPSNEIQGVTVESYAVISASSTILPGVYVNRDSIVGAGAIVTKDVLEEKVVVGNPAKVVCSIHDVKIKISGQSPYPWKYNFKRGMPWE